MTRTLRAARTGGEEGGRCPVMRAIEAMACIEAALKITSGRGRLSLVAKYSILSHILRM
jgi:hypothetical protein